MTSIAQSPPRSLEEGSKPLTKPSPGSAPNTPGPFQNCAWTIFGTHSNRPRLAKPAQHMRGNSLLASFRKPSILVGFANPANPAAGRLNGFPGPTAEPTTWQELKPTIFKFSQQPTAVVIGSLSVSVGSSILRSSFFDEENCLSSSDW